MKKTEMIRTTGTADREYKNNVFCMLFEDKRNVLELYNAINHSAHNDPEELQIVTLKNAIYMTIKNDLAFVIDTRLNLYEHQSTYNPNIPLRDLYYVSDEYEKLVSRQSTYASTRVRIPAPRFVVFYNGTEKRPEVEEFRLSDLYEIPDTDPQLELKVTVLNINPGNNEALLQSCKVLDEYMRYVNCVRKHLAESHSIDDAVSSAIDECIRNGILRDFLIQNKSEAIHMSIYEYNEVEEKEKMRRQEHEGGYREGLEDGQQKQLATIVRKLLKKGLSLEEIAEFLEEDLEVLKKIQQSLKAQ